MLGGARDPIKLVFLDIDGVICCNAYGRLEEGKLELLKRVCTATGAKVVLSTDWRRIPQLKAQLISTLRGCGLQCVGATPCRPNWLAVRPEEIVAWMKGYAGAPNAADKPPIGAWVAVDDRPLLQEQGGDELRGHFVRTKLAVGLTERLAQRMIEVLNGDEAAADPSPAPVRAHALLIWPAADAAPLPARAPHTPAPRASAPAPPQAHAAAYATPPPISAEPPFSLASKQPPGSALDVRRSVLARTLPSSSSSAAALGSSGFTTPPPTGTPPPSPFGQPSDEPKAAALRSFAAGRAALPPAAPLTLRRASVGTPPPQRFGGGAVGGRSPPYGAAPTVGSAQWWNSRVAASPGTGADAPGARSPLISVYGSAGSPPRPRYAH